MLLRTGNLGCSGNDPGDRMTYIKSNRGIMSEADYPFEKGYVRTHTHVADPKSTSFRVKP